jgi:hypothetical protein
VRRKISSDAGNFRRDAVRHNSPCEVERSGTKKEFYAMARAGHKEREARSG